MGYCRCRQRLQPNQPPFPPYRDLREDCALEDWRHAHPLPTVSSILACIMLLRQSTLHWMPNLGPETISCNITCSHALMYDALC
jgi:hypothetical protein